ncbi:MAG: FlgD immunoglobulin-like domain containing protein, partial [bacterium]
TTTYSGNFSFDNATWQVVVKDTSGEIVRTLSGVGPSFDATWDGTDDQAQLQPEGLYSFYLSSELGSGSTNGTAATTLDNTPPSALISAPVQAAVLSNVYQTTANGVVGTATDLNFLNWTLEYGAGASPVSWTVLRNAITTPIVGGQLGGWDTTALGNGTYTVRLRVYDKAGNLSIYSSTITVGNFTATQSVKQFNAATGQTQTYTSIVPFPLTEIIMIKKQTGEVVRTLVNAQRSAGTYNDVWNGRNDSNVLAADGGYKYFATVTDGVHTFTWDMSSRFGTGIVDYLPGTGSWDPLNNKPLKIPFYFAEPTALTILFSDHDLVPWVDYCNAPRVCTVVDRYVEAGTHAFYWVGVDNSGVYRDDLSHNLILGRHDHFPQNA